MGGRSQRVYASLPLSGPSAVSGREVLLGVQLCHELRPVAELVVLDSYGPDRDDVARGNAYTAADDADALAYIGDFHSSQVLVTAPILGSAGLLQIAPVATFVGLGGPTLVRLMPNDEAGARAIARWLANEGVEEILVVHDHDDGYGKPVGRMCAEALSSRGLGVRVRPVWDEAPARAELAGAQAIVYAGIGGPGIASFWESLHALDERLWLVGTDGVAVPRLASDLSHAAAERSRLFVAQRAPFALYGFEAMALALDSMAAGNADRARVVSAALGTQNRESLLGPYSLDDAGLTTTGDYGRMAIVGGQLVWDLD